MSGGRWRSASPTAGPTTPWSATSRESGQQRQLWGVPRAHGRSPRAAASGAARSSLRGRHRARRLPGGALSICGLGPGSSSGAPRPGAQGRAHLVPGRHASTGTRMPSCPTSSTSTSSSSAPSRPPEARGGRQPPPGTAGGRSGLDGRAAQEPLPQRPWGGHVHDRVRHGQGTVEDGPVRGRLGARAGEGSLVVHGAV